MPDISDVIRTKLNQLISDGKTSQYRLSKDSGVDQSNISKFLRGKVDMTSRNLSALCRAAGIRRIDLG